MSHSVSPTPPAGPDGSPGALQLHLLGPPGERGHVSWQGETLRVSAPRMLALLTYLHVQGPTRRDDLECLLWPGQGARAVRQGLYTLRHLPGSDHWLSEAGAEVTLHARSDWADAHAALAQGDLGRACELLAAGTLLEGLTVGGSGGFQEWLEEQRGELTRVELAALREDAARLPPAQARARLARAITLDALDEGPVRDLMRLEAREGRPEAALEVFETLRRILHAEVGEEPGEETLAALRDVQGGGTPGSSRARLLGRGEVPEQGVLRGRDAELAEVRAALEREGRVLVQGLAGMGKTRLAWAAAQHTVDPDGPAPGSRVLWLEAGTDRAEALRGALLSALGHRTDATPPDWAALFGAQDVRLLVLDDAADSYALSALLQELPASLKVLVTSRLRLPRLPTVRLRRLSREAAMALVQGLLEGDLHGAAGHDIAGHEIAGHEIAGHEIDALCALLGDHPYAVRLAALTLAQGRQPVRELLQALSDAPHDLGQERSVAALLRRSLDGLDAASYEAYLGLGSLFTPQCTPALLALALRRPEADTETALYTLTRHGLTTREAQPGREQVTYRMHDLTWAHARQHAALQPATVLNAAVTYAGTFADRPEALHADLGNLIGAAGAAGASLVALLGRWLAGPYVLTYGWPPTLRAALADAVDLAERAASWPVAGLLAAQLGNVQHMIVGDHAAGLNAYLRAATFAERAGQSAEAATRLAVAGGLQAVTGRPGSESTLERAWAHAQRSGDPLCLGRVLEQRGIARAMGGDLEGGYRDLRAAQDHLLPLLDGTDGRTHEVGLRYLNVLMNLGQALIGLERLPEALALRQEALRLAEASGEGLRLAGALVNVAEVLNLLDRPAEACAALDRAEGIYQDLGAVGQALQARAMRPVAARSRERP